MATKKGSTKKTTKKVTKKTTTKKPVKKVVKKEVKEEIKNEVVKEEVVVNEEKKVKGNKRYLIIGLLYFMCSVIWFTGSISKLMIQVSYKFDILVSIILLLAACSYFVCFIKKR